MKFAVKAIALAMTAAAGFGMVNVTGGFSPLPYGKTVAVIAIALTISMAAWLLGLSERKS